jgi:hypothetical protein
MKDPRADVIKKALADPAFKAELLNNSTSAVEKATGVKVPAGVSIKVVEDSASVVHLVLPRTDPPGELKDAQLAKVAGGAGVFTQIVCDACSDGPKVNVCSATAPKL